MLDTKKENVQCIFATQQYFKFILYDKNNIYLVKKSADPRLIFSDLL